MIQVALFQSTNLINEAEEMKRKQKQRNNMTKTERDPRIQNRRCFSDYFDKVKRNPWQDMAQRTK